MLKILVYKFFAFLSYDRKLLARFLNVESLELTGGISDLGDDFNLLLKANTYIIDLLDYCFFKRLECYVLFCDNMCLIFNYVFDDIEVIGALAYEPEYKVFVLKT